MKSKFFLIVTLVFLFISASISAENKTAFYDLDLIVNKSDVGIKLIKKISIFIQMEINFYLKKLY